MLAHWFPLSLLYIRTFPTLDLKGLCWSLGASIVCTFLARRSNLSCPNELPVRSRAGHASQSRLCLQESTQWTASWEVSPSAPLLKLSVGYGAPRERRRCWYDCCVRVRDDSVAAWSTGQIHSNPSRPSSLASAC